MDAVYEELRDAKSEIQDLKEKYRVKSELAESLKRANNDQLIKIKEANSKVEKLSQELYQKNDEIYNAVQMYEELKSKLDVKESILKRVSSSHDKLREDYSQNLKKLEEENRSLASALDEANAHSFDQEQKICSLEREIEGVKRILAFPEKKCLEKESKNTFEARENEYFQLDDEKKKLEDQLKWKKEQFVHLEEAHRKLKNEVKNKEKEWQKEKSELLGSIVSLETDLESRIRISRDFELRFEMCNSALAHAEGKRKLLENELSEVRRNFDGVCAEYNEAKLSFESLSSQRDQEIANLRSSLGAKEILYKEMEYQFKRSEQEKLDLLVSLKELQEAQIKEANFSYSSSKIQNKLKAKESEWRAKEEKLSEELNSCKMELKNRESKILELELLIKAKKSEWRAQEERLSEELNSCKFELNNREKEILEMEMLKAKEKRLSEELNSCKLEMENRESEILEQELLIKAEKSEWQAQEERLSEELNSCKFELKNRESEILEMEMLKVKEKRLSEELNSCKLEMKIREKEILELELLRANESKWRAHEERLSEELNSCKLELKNRKSEILELEMLKEKESKWRALEERLSEELSSCKMELRNRESEILELEMLKEKESKWQAQEKRLLEELNSCKMELKNKEKEILGLELLKVKESESMEDKLSDEVNSRISEVKKKEKEILDLELLNWETSLSLLILKSELCCMDFEKKEQEGNMHMLHKLVEQLKEEMERLKGILEVQSDEHSVRLQSENKKSEKLSEELNHCRSELQTRNELLSEVNRELKACYSQILELELKNQESSLTLMVLKSEFPCLKLKHKECVVESEENAVQMQAELIKVEEEFYEKLCEASEIEFELQAWKSSAEQLELSLQQALTMRREVEASLFAHIEVEMSLRKEREDLIFQLEEKENEMKNLQLQSNANSDVSTPETAERIYKLVEEKEERIYDLQQQVAVLEKEFESSTASFSSKLSRMQKERNFPNEKNIVISELEKKKIQETRSEKEKKEPVVRKLECELEIEAESSVKTMEKLKMENMKLSNAVHFVLEKMDGLNMEEDVKLMERLGKIVEGFDDDDDVKENVSIVLSSSNASPLMKKVEAVRSPLRTINS